MPVVARVHGDSHPEFHEVRGECTMPLRAKIKAAGTSKPDLESEFKKLREITDDYTVPP